MTLVGVLISSVLGSLHCAGMCGPFYLLLSRFDGSKLQIKLFYHLGRLFTYFALASVVRFFVPIEFVQENNWLPVVFLVIWISLMLGLAKPIPVFSNVISSLLRKTRKLNASIGGFVTGVLTTLIPCGWLYGFILLSATQETWIQGMQYIGVFWLGTVPALVISHDVMSRLNLKMGDRLRWVAVGIMVAVVVMRLVPGAHHHHH